MSDIKRMELDELHLTPEYVRLTVKQKMFVDTYVASGMLDGNYDPVTATNSAYPCKSEEVARVMSYELLGNINIIAALNRHFGNNTTDDFMQALDRAIRNKKLTLAQLGALRLKCDVLGLRTGIPALPETHWQAPNGAVIPRHPKNPKKPKKAVEASAVTEPSRYSLD